MDRIVLDKDFTLCYVKCGEHMGFPYEEWIEMRCGTCKTNKTCEDKVEKAFRGCDKWVTDYEVIMARERGKEVLAKKLKEVDMTTSDCNTKRATSGGYADPPCQDNIHYWYDTSSTSTGTEPFYLTPCMCGKVIWGNFKKGSEG